MHIPVPDSGGGYKVKYRQHFHQMFCSRNLNVRGVHFGCVFVVAGVAGVAVVVFALDCRNQEFISHNRWVALRSFYPASNPWSSSLYLYLNDPVLVTRPLSPKTPLPTEETSGRREERGNFEDQRTSQQDIAATYTSKDVSSVVPPAETGFSGLEAFPVRKDALFAKGDSSGSSSSLGNGDRKGLKENRERSASVATGESWTDLAWYGLDKLLRAPAVSIVQLSLATFSVPWGNFRNGLLNKLEGGSSRAAIEDQSIGEGRSRHRRPPVTHRKMEGIQEVGVTRDFEGALSVGEANSEERGASPIAGKGFEDRNQHGWDRDGEEAGQEHEPSDGRSYASQGPSPPPPIPPLPLTAAGVGLGEGEPVKSGFGNSSGSQSGAGKESPRRLFLEFYGPVVGVFAGLGCPAWAAEVLTVIFAQVCPLVAAAPLLHLSTRGENHGGKEGTSCACPSVCLSGLCRV